MSSRLRFAVCLTVIALAGSLFAQPLWHVDFTAATDAEKAEWKFTGSYEFTPEGFVTTSIPDSDNVSVTISPTLEEIPNGFDGKILRVTWKFIPVKIGGWGSDFRFNSAMVVEMTGNRPTLNTRHEAIKSLEAGIPCVMTCDFSQYLITSWTINGTEQLAAPVPIWMNGNCRPLLYLADFIDTDSRTIWQDVSIEYVQSARVGALRLAAGDAFPVMEKDRRADFLLGQASPMQKVFREAHLFPGTLSRNVHIAAAGRERESFQLVVFPLDKPLKNVTVDVTDHIATDGKAADFPASRIAVHPVGYVRTVTGAKAGWQWPDVLLPRRPFEVEPGFVQPVWFTVDVPDGTAPGEYYGLVEVRADGVEPQTATVTLTVLPYSLPLRGTLKTAFSICPGMWEIWYRPDEVKRRLGMADSTSHDPLYTSYECEDVLPKAKWLEMYDFLLAHRLSPTVIYSTLKNGRARVVPSMEDMQYCYDRGMNATCLMCIRDISENPQAAEKALADIDEWLSGWETFVKEKNWTDFTWYLHSYDESEMLPAERREHMDYAIRTTNRHIGERFPWIRRETANPYMERHKDDFDIWTPVTPQIDDRTIGNYRRAQAEGQEAWAYVCCGPGQPYANLFIDLDGVCPRILPWQFFQYRLTGFLYWLVNHYEPTKNWNMDAPKWPDEPWNCFSFNTNSDGILIYPGPDATPLASTRLENLRDGIEDYEALAILRNLMGRFTPKTDEDSALLQEAQKLVDVPPEVTSSWTSFTKDPQVILGARRGIDELIAKMQDAGPNP